MPLGGLREPFKFGSVYLELIMWVALPQNINKELEGFGMEIQECRVAPVWFQNYCKGY